MSGVNQTGTALQGRLVSLDAFRGVTMLLMISGGFGLHYVIDYPIWGAVARQFTHHEWNGLYFWDLIQPFFMFIVGVAMPFSFNKRWQKGDTWTQSLSHVIRRSLLLIILSLIYSAYGSGKIDWQHWNVLSQLAFTYLLAFLLMKKSIRVQLLFSIALLILYDLAYRIAPMAGAADPWIPDQNLGSAIDLIIIGKLSPGHWVTINCISTAAHTIWGVIAGTVILSDRAEKEKIKQLLLMGIIGVIAGYALDPVTPIIKRIATSSFVIVTGGWSFLALLLFYWLIDLKGYKDWAHFLVIIGTNSIFIYMVSGLLKGWMARFFGVFILGFEDYIGIMAKIINDNLVIFGHWYLCYFLYKHKIFLKL